MTGQPVAADQPAGDSVQPDTAPSLIPPGDKIPSAIDTSVEGVEGLVAAEGEGAGTPVAPAPAPADVVSNVPAADAALQQELAAYKEDHQTLNMIRNDPVASKWFNEHYAAKARGEGTLPEGTGDEPADAGANGALGIKVDKLFGMVETILQDNQKRDARDALVDFAAQNPVVRDPKVATKMQELLRHPGVTELSLQRILTLALSELGMSAKSAGPAPLRTTEVAGAPRDESSDSEDAVQKRIDSQDSFDKGLDMALRETAKEQGFI